MSGWLVDARHVGLILLLTAWGPKLCFITFYRTYSKHRRSACDGSFFFFFSQNHTLLCLSLYVLTCSQSEGSNNKVSLVYAPQARNLTHDWQVICLISNPRWNQKPGRRSVWRCEAMLERSKANCSSMFTSQTSQGSWTAEISSLKSFRSLFSASYPIRFQQEYQAGF